MLAKYIEAAMRHAEYEVIEDDTRSTVTSPALAACGRMRPRSKDAAKNSSVHG